MKENLNRQLTTGNWQWTKNKLLLIAYCLLFIVPTACNNNPSASIQPEEQYTCPMPEDSVFSNKPGSCPKCGMDLVKVEQNTEDPVTYTCPMHPQVLKDKFGSCSICGMDLEKKKPESETKAVSLNVLLKPVNRQVVASVPMIHIMAREEEIEMESYGFIAYDTRQVGAISSNVSGRIEKLYVRHRFQKISKGQKIIDIYSPELLTAQQNLLFLLKNDPENEMIIAAARQKLLLMGMSDQQLNQVIKSEKPAFTVSIYSRYSGHIHESGLAAAMENEATGIMNGLSLITDQLLLKEGMNVQKGQNLFTVYNPGKAWALLNIFAGQAAMIKVGDKVRITPETATHKDFRASISFIEPFYRKGSKTLTARVYFDNSTLQIPIGSQVKATVFAGNRIANWLPEEAVLSLGLDKVVFLRKGEAFVAHKIETGIVNNHLIQVLSGLAGKDAVAANAQYLMDSESFIKVNR